MIAPPIAKRAYNTMALFSLVNLMALVAVGVYLCVSGVIDGDKLSRIGAVLRGASLAEAGPAAPAEPVEEEPEAAETPLAADVLAESQMNLEIMRREADRIKEELHQQLALANSIMIRVTAQREAYEQERVRDDKEREFADLRLSTEGFKKTVELLKGLKPKQALSHLLAVPDPDEAANILLNMDTRSAKKIVGAAKSAEELARMTEILQRWNGVAPQRSGRRGTGGE